LTAAEQLRALPSVESLLQQLAGWEARYPRRLIVEETRRALDLAREAIRDGRRAPALLPAIAAALERLETPSFQRVINATGVVLHTNLGRAPLPQAELLAGYSNLEYDLTSGKRGKRDVHAASLLERLLGHPAIAVNNNAAAVYLALHELAAGYEVIVSRGELIEIGDGFRIPDIMQRSGAILREVGTTNRTRVDDYRAALNERTRLILRVHPSNFHIRGFTARPDVRELADLGRQAGIPVYEDLGSGCLVDLQPYGVTEPLVQDSLAAGVSLVSFSGDKLLGGPQAGILAGRPELIARLRRNPMFRALRLDKVMYQLLEVTLREILLERWDRVPALRMIRLSEAEIRARAQALLDRMPGLAAELISGESVIGGGSTPDQAVPTCLIALRVADPAEAERALRAYAPPVIVRIAQERILIDLRTVLPEEEPLLDAALARFAA